MTTPQDAENILAEARCKLTRLQLGKLEETDTYRDAAREARANADKHPNDFKAADRAERLEVSEVEAFYSAAILRTAADIASDTDTALLIRGIDAHGAAKAAANLEREITKMASEADIFLAAVRAEGNAKAAAALEGEAVGRFLAVQILGKAAQAMRAAAETAEADNALD